MSLVGKVGRKRFRSRLAFFGLYGVLILGAATTLYPFLLMALTGFKGPTDQNDTAFIPRYWTDVASKDPSGKTSQESLLGKYLADKYAGDLDRIASTRMGANAPASETASYEQFLGSLPPDYFDAGFRTQLGQVTGRLAARYQKWLKARYGSVDRLNKAYIEENLSFETVAPPPEMLGRKDWRPPTTPEYREWLMFKSELPPEFRIPVRATEIYQQYLRSKFQNQFGLVPRDLAAGAKSFEQLALPPAGPTLDEFRAKGLPARFLTATIEQLWTLRYSGPLPIEADEARFVADHAASIRTEFAGRNYSFVLDYIALNGRALWNTAIFCGLAILLQLIVNPLAAYALSRYPMPATAKILLFLLATMAFPAEVALIPSFLLLKQLHLLNTFAALVLPGAASGYMIFLLKGFFDSLPAELFEAGQIDGAREATMMMRIAMPLSRPVLGYLALIAFMGAYGAFMFAFLVAQDQKVWTLMVWIYNLQTYAPKAVIMAALTIAAIPTLIVFLLAQKVIMEGIILPGEK